MSLIETNIDELVSSTHPYRKILILINFKQLTRPLRKLYSKEGRSGYPVETMFKCLLLQHMEDLSGRELERFLEENLAAKLFCGFSLREATPDHSSFSYFRQRIGTKMLAKLFNRVRNGLKQQGLVQEIFTFVDASNLISKAQLWEERDKAIKAGLEKLNNAAIKQFSADKDARFGCKGKDKFWFGYKRHVSVDMKHGLINKVAITPANVTDQSGLKHICPNSGLVVGDKQYCLKKALLTMLRKGCSSGAILRNNMLGKNKEKDKWLTALRMPYEGVFSKMNKRTRYRGRSKNQFAGFLDALVFNIKRLIKIEAPPIPLEVV